MDSQTKSFIVTVIAAAIVLVSLIVSVTYYHVTIDLYAMQNGYEQTMVTRPGGSENIWVKSQPKE